MRRLLLLFALVPFLVPVPSVATGFRPCENATIIGTRGPDFLVGTGRNDVIRARGGNDTILGLGGMDVICGGPGDDDVDGGDGSDWLYGMRGIDHCSKKDYDFGCERG